MWLIERILGYNSGGKKKGKKRHINRLNIFGKGKKNPILEEFLDFLPKG